MSCKGYPNWLSTHLDALTRPAFAPDPPRPAERPADDELPPREVHRNNGHWTILMADRTEVPLPPEAFLQPTPEGNLRVYRRETSYFWRRETMFGPSDRWHAAGYPVEYVVAVIPKGQWLAYFNADEVR